MQLPPPPPKVHIPIRVSILEKTGNDITKCPKCKTGFLETIATYRNGFYAKATSLKRFIRLLLKSKTRHRHNHKTKKRMRKLKILKTNTSLYFMGRGFFAYTSNNHKCLKEYIKIPAVKRRTMMYKYT